MATNTYKTNKYKSGTGIKPMRIQARPGSRAARGYYQSALPGLDWPMPKQIAPGIDPAPLLDLIFHGGKVVPQMEYQNIFLGGQASWKSSDIASIDEAIKLAMQDRRLNNVMLQYFPGAKLLCDARELLLLDEPKPKTLDQPDVEAQVAALFDAGKIGKKDLATTIFNLVLPPGTKLKLDSDDSFNGLGGFHGSTHIKRAGKTITLYYSANVFSQKLADGDENGIVAFDRPWKNVVATLYHELNEFRTDPDVNDAIRDNNNDFLGWTSRRGHEVGDQPVEAADPLEQVFKQVKAAKSAKRVPVQFMYSNAVHGAEGPIEKPHT